MRAGDLRFLAWFCVCFVPPAYAVAGLFRAARRSSLWPFRSTDLSLRRTYAKVPGYVARKYTLGSMDPEPLVNAARRP